jgi:hypothetical protein
MSFRELTDQVLDVCMQTMGETVVYTPGAGAPVTIEAIFDRASVIADTGAGAAGQGFATTLRLKSSALPSPPSEGDQVEAQGETYLVVDSHDDGYGELTLVLEAE